MIHIYPSDKHFRLILIVSSFELIVSCKIFSYFISGADVRNSIHSIWYTKYAASHTLAAVLSFCARCCRCLCFTRGFFTPVNLPRKTFTNYLYSGVFKIKINAKAYRKVRERVKQKRRSWTLFISRDGRIESDEVITSTKQKKFDPNKRDFVLKRNRYGEIFRYFIYHVLHQNTFTFFACHPSLRLLFFHRLISASLNYAFFVSFSCQLFRMIVMLCALVLPMTNAVINSPSESKVERREAPFETYGPPPVQQQHQQHAQTFIVQPVYGAPAVSKYPAPPPERPPPPPAQEYGTLTSHCLVNK